MAHFEKKISEQTIYNGKVVEFSKHIVELENGSHVTREVIKHNGGVCVLAIDENDDILMVSQFRYAANSELLELPAGKMNLGEDPYECGARELIEETGYRAAELKLLTKFFPTPAYCTEVIYIYLADKLIQDSQQLDNDEFLTVKRIPFNKALEMVLNGEIPDGKTQLGILTLATRRHK